MSSDALEVVEFDAGRSSFVDQKINLRFNQSNIYTNMQTTPGSQWRGGIGAVTPIDQNSDQAKYLQRNLVANFNNHHTNIDLANSAEELYASLTQSLHDSLILKEQFRI